MLYIIDNKYNKNLVYNSDYISINCYTGFGCIFKLCITRNTRNSTNFNTFIINLYIFSMLIKGINEKYNLSKQLIDIVLTTYRFSILFHNLKIKIYFHLTKFSYFNHPWIYIFKAFKHSIPLLV